MTRVAQVMAGARHGGAELFYERLCIALHGAGDSILAVIRRDAARAARLRGAGLEVVEFDFGGAFDFRTSRQLAHLLGRFGPEVAVGWMNRANAHLPRGNWVSAGRLGGYYDLRHYKRRDHLIGNTHGIVAWLRARGWDDARTHYLPNFSSDLGGAVPAVDIAGQSGFPGPWLLGLGRLHTDKGFDVLLEAMQYIVGARLLLAGTGPEQSRLERLARRLGVAERVRFLGWRTDVGALLGACHLFVCSSRIEPLGNMVLEAWSARRPVVAARAAGPTELITDGYDGLLVPLDDAKSLAGAVSSLLLDPSRAAAMAAAGRAKYKTEFSEAPVLHRWRSWLADIASGRSTPT